MSMRNNSREHPNKKQSQIIKIIAVTGIIGIFIWFFTLQNITPTIDVKINQNSTNIENPPTSTPPPPTSTPTPTQTPHPQTPRENTTPKNQATVKIGSNTFTFNSTQVETIRPDIFKQQ